MARSLPSEGKPTGIPPALALLQQLSRQVSRSFDGWVTSLLASTEALEQETMKQKLAPSPPAQRSHLGRLPHPEEEVKQLMLQATQLEDIWRFFAKRLHAGSEVDFMALSVLDEQEDFIQIPFITSQAGYSLAEPYRISLADKQNHLVQTFLRKDTTFSAKIDAMGADLLSRLKASEPTPLEHPFPDLVNLFSIPFVAGNKTVAALTLGFSEVDAFSQAKLSYVYALRDPLAQLLWNLLLQQRVRSQTRTQVQVDGLTGLLTHSCFQQNLSKELERALAHKSPLTVMLLDISDLQTINETHGHHIGDEAICHVASTVRRLVRGVDTVARYGGDEIVVLLPETDAEVADETARRFIQGLSDRLPETLKTLSISIGYATCPTDANQRDPLLRLAEQALQVAKFRGQHTHTSTRIGCREIDYENEKTVVEVFAAHVAKKYNTSGSSLFNDVMRCMEHRAEEAAITTAEHLMLETIGSLAGALEAKDQYTRGHSQAVANYAVAMAHAMGMSAVEIEQVRLAAFLHDIGKIGVPEYILSKPGRLTEEEYDIMKEHPVIGARQILAPVSALKPIIPLVLHHHENWDGTGHPGKLKGEEIPLGARIVAIVDAFHALTSDRPYRPALTLSETKRILCEESGRKWDPQLIGIFMEILDTAKAEALEGEEAPLSSINEEAAV